MPDPHRIIGWAWVAVAVLWLTASLTAKPTLRRESIRSRLGHIALGVLAGLLIFDRGLWKGSINWQVIPRSPASAYLGLLITLAGLGCAVWARLALGSNWSGTVTVKHDHELVRSGPYAIVRHPIYSGCLLALLGTAIANGDL